MRKNVASQVVSGQLASATDGSDVTTGTTTVYVTGDGGTQASGGTATHEGQGTWSFLPSQANTNYDQVTFTFVNAAAVSAVVQIYPVSYDPTDAVRLGMTALPNAAADAAGGLPISDAGGLDMDDIPLNAELNARTLLAAAYFDPAADTVVNVTNVATLTGHTAQTGDSYAALAAAIVAETHDATLLGQLRQLVSLVESQRGAHTHQVQGSVFYVDPVNGDTHANGNRGGDTDPYLGIQDCHDNAVTDSNHDCIILRSGAAAGVTTLTEDVTLSKRYLLIRGPGRDFVWTRSGSGDTIAVTADGIELSGFQLETAATGSGDGIQVTDADFLRVHNLWINDTRGDGINILRGENCQITNNVFTGTGQGGSGQGVHIVGTAGTSNRNHIRNNVFHQCAGDGVLIEQGTTNQTLIGENIFEGNSGYGINVGGSSTDAFLHDNKYGNNTSGEVLDGGTTTTRVDDEERARHSIATELRLAELDPANIPADVDAILIDTADMQPKLGSPAGASMSADIAENQTDLDTIISTGSTGPWTTGGGGGGGDGFAIIGMVYPSGSNWFWVASLRVNGSDVNTGVSAPAVVGAFGQNGGTTLGYTQVTAPALDAQNALYGSFSLGTTPTTGVPWYLEVTAVYAAATYRGRLQVVVGA